MAREKQAILAAMPRIGPGEKWCRTCQSVKPLTDFPKASDKSSGVGSRCKACRRVVESPYRIAKAVSRITHPRQQFGMSQADYDAALTAQSNACAICHETLTLPHIDHCHATGQVRGILCSRCNTRLGAIEAEGFLPKALAYIAHHAAQEGRFFVTERGKKSISAQRRYKAMRREHRRQARVA